jgi:hypothetical protein
MLHESLLRELYNILQKVYEQKPLNPKVVLDALDQYIYNNPLFQENGHDLTGDIEDLERGLKVFIYFYNHLIF